VDGAPAEGGVEAVVLARPSLIANLDRFTSKTGGRHHRPRAGVRLFLFVIQFLGSAHVAAQQA